jgi:hypothetical protein
MASWHGFTGTGSVPIPAGRTRSREIIGKLIAGVRLVQQKGGWEVEYFTYEFPSGANTVLEPDELTLAKVLDDLKPLVARGPHALPKLTEQQWEEIRSRLKQGESVNSVSAYYRVDEAAIEAVAKYR